MKTLCEYPGLIGEVLARAEVRRGRRAQGQARARRVQAACNAALRWVLWPLVRMIAALVAGIGIAAALCQVL